METEPECYALRPVTRGKVRNSINIAALEPLYANLRSRLDQTEIAASTQFTSLSEEARVLREGQHEIFSRMIGLESALGKAKSDLLAQQRCLNTLQADMIDAQHPGPGNNGPVHHKQTLGAAQAAPHLTDALGASWVAPHCPDNTPRMPQDFANGNWVVDRQDVVLPSLVTTSATSAPIPQNGVNMTEAARSLGPYDPGLDPLETMLTPFETVVNYRHYRLTDITADPTTGDFRQIPRIKSQVQGLHPTLKRVTGFELVMLLTFLAIVRSSLRALDKLEGVDVRAFDYLLMEDANDEYDALVNPGTARSPLHATWRDVVHDFLARF